MSKISRRTFLASAALPVLAQGPKARLRRKDSYFGLHFDLHPNKTDTILGRDVTEEMIERMLERTQPDYIQYDCKGHPGWLGYPSQVSKSAGMVKDSLALWRKVTARRGVALYIHFSGVWDSLAVEEHPEWARVTPEGKPDDRITSTFGPYVDVRMIPQLREAATKYSLDGAWVDGECWATAPDYSKAVEEKFGVPLPRKPEEPRWQQFLEFNREQFRRYARHYLDELHKSHPQFQVASNWMYTTFVPERPELPVDFISGDYLGNASIETARLEARYLSAVDRPWDLMAWGFQSGGNNSRLGHIHKNPEHLMQEASVVLAQGGGFQVYYVPTRTGYFDDKLIGAMASVAKFCRERQEVCHKTETVPMAGLLFSKRSLYQTSNKLFGGWPGQLTGPARGLVAAMSECHFPVDVIPEWKAAEVASAHGLIVVPDWKDVGGEMKALLTKYAEDGGSLLVVGAENSRLFSDVLGVRLAGEPSDQPCWVAGAEIVANVRGLWQDFEAAGAEVVEQRYPSTDLTRDAKPAATVVRRGKGRIAAIYGPIGSVFEQSHAPAARQFLKRVIDRIWTPPVLLDAPPTIEVVVRKKAGKTIVHLNNSTGMQVASDYATTDFIPPVGPIRLSMRMEKAPVRVQLEPGGAKVKGNWEKGVWKGEVPSVSIHSALVFES